MNLRCEYHVNPLGIGEKSPRLSWEVVSDDPFERGQRQTAYRIIVASTREKLDANIGDLWDTGVVRSDQTNQIVYAGKTLRSGQKCWWKVQVWDKDGHPSPWSEPAFWTMGLLDPQDWRAKWIGYDDPAEWEERALNFVGCQWIWFPEDGNPRYLSPQGNRYFRRPFTLPADGAVVRARMLVTVDDQFVLFINGKEVGRSDGKPDAWRRPKTFNLTPALKPGRNLIALLATNTSPSPAGVIAKLVVEFSEGEPFILVTDGEWRCSDREEADWTGLEFDDHHWVHARSLGRYGIPPWGIVSPDTVYVPPLPFLRKTFIVERPIRNAFLYVSALGTCEVRLNGRRVTEDYFIPGWSDFRKRVYYRTYEVTGLVREGENVLGVILNDEWYAGYCGGWGQRNAFGGEPRLSLQLHLELADGMEQIVVTDETWKASYGPLLEADFYMGETYDARREMPGWDTPGFDDKGWKPVTITEKIPLTLTSHPGPPIRKVMEISPKSVGEVRPGVFVFDMGQNMVGVVRLRVRGAKPGTKIVLRYGEVLNPDGTIYTANLRGARNTDIYICKGEPEEVWEPRFTFRGFRYVEMTGYPGTPPLDSVTGLVLHSDVPIVGEFECDHRLVNRLFENIVWGLRGNYLEVPTDCPQRDERQGWTGDAQIFVRTATYIADIAAFMTKWMRDLNDGQRKDGAYPDVAPAARTRYGSPAWADAGIIIPFTLWRVYGDTRILERYYENMAHYIDYLLRNSENFLRPNIGYGDWVPAGAVTPKDVLATAYFAYVVRLMAEIAEALSRPEDARHYRELFEAIKTAFNNAYVRRDGRIKGETQTVYALALDLDLLPEDLRPSALHHLVTDIEERDGHLSTGFVGTRHLMLALTRMSRTDVAYRLLLQETYPSWLYTVRMGATTIWERWDSYTEDRGFQTPDMNSFNHYAFGSLGEWIFRALVGIDTETPGFKRFIIRPHLDTGLKAVRARYHSIAGAIEISWHRGINEFRLNITIPPNTVATVYVPAESPDVVFEGGKPARDAEGVTFLRMEKDTAVFEVVAGRYEFIVIKGSE